MSLRVANSNSRMRLDTAKLADREPDVSFKTAVKKVLGNLEGFDVHHSLVLTASYIQPRKTRGGILLPDSALDEDRWQGKVNLILKLGPTAFKYQDGGYPYEGKKPDVGDYVIFYTSDGREIGINGVSCRLVESYLIKMNTPDPDRVY